MINVMVISVMLTKTWWSNWRLWCLKSKWCGIHLFRESICWRGLMVHKRWQAQCNFQNGLKSFPGGAFAGSLDLSSAESWSASSSSLSIGSGWLLVMMTMSQRETAISDQGDLPITFLWRFNDRLLHPGDQVFLLGWTHYIYNNMIYMQYNFPKTRGRGWGSKAVWN